MRHTKALPFLPGRLPPTATQPRVLLRVSYPPPHPACSQWYVHTRVHTYVLTLTRSQTYVHTDMPLIYTHMLTVTPLYTYSHQQTHMLTHTLAHVHTPLTHATCFAVITTAKRRWGWGAAEAPWLKIPFFFVLNFLPDFYYTCRARSLLSASQQGVREVGGSH